MNRLNSLIKAATADCVKNVNGWVPGNLNGWGEDVLELCVLLEKAERALEMLDYGTRYPQAIEALAEIKRWKEGK